MTKRSFQARGQEWTTHKKMTEAESADLDRDGIVIQYRHMRLIVTKEQLAAFMRQIVEEVPADKRAQDLAELEHLIKVDDADFDIPAKRTEELATRLGNNIVYREAFRRLMVQ